MAYALTWNTTGYDFSEEAELVDWDDPSRIPLEIVPRRHGAVVSEDVVLDPRTIYIKGKIADTTRALVETRLNLLMKQLNSGAKQLRFDGTRQITCYKKSGDYQFVEGTGLLACEYSLALLAVDPFWYNVSQSSVDEVAAGSPHAWTHANGGDAMIYPTISIIAPGGGNVVNPAITNVTTGLTFTYTGTVLAGNTLAIDMANFTVLNNGVNVLSACSGNFFSLNSGNNSMSIAYTTSNPTVRIAYNQRFYGPAFQ